MVTFGIATGALLRSSGLQLRILFSLDFISAAMLRGQCSAAARLCVRRTSYHAVKLSSSARTSSQGPNAPLELDPSLQDLLRDADMALLKHKPRENIVASSSAVRELEVLDFDESIPERIAEDEDELKERRERKSARARFGSNGIGSVFLPTEIRDAIERIIDGILFF